MTTEAQMQQLREAREKSLLGGGQGKIDEQHKAGKLTARERIELLVDKGSFSEIGMFGETNCIDFGMERKKVRGDAVVTGFGTVDGRKVFIFAQDATVLSGTMGYIHAIKICNVIDMAMNAGAPIIGLYDGAGGRIQEGYGAMEGSSQWFYKTALASGVVPQISAIMGTCIGVGTYCPALMDFIFMIDKIGQMFITGPKVIKAMLSKELEPEEVGGSRIHSEVSGVSDFVAGDDQDCIFQIKRLLSFLPSNNKELAPIKEDFEPPPDEEKIEEIVPDNPRKIYDVREVVKKIVDGSDFFEIKRDFAKNIVTGFARIAGKPIGIIANQPSVLAGALDIKASRKGARFIQFCDAFNIPILSIHDNPAYLPGLEQEHGGIITQGAKMLYAFSEATVPKIILILRKSYGGGNAAMCNHGLRADLMFAWPSAEIAVMGAESAAEILFKKEIAKAEDPGQKRSEKIQEYRLKFASPYNAASALYIDEVIEPKETRERLIKALNTLEKKQVSNPWRKHGIMPF
jgi:acetyl-CoA carboxylase carboxyltransferase component